MARKQSAFSIMPPRVHAAMIPGAHDSSEQVSLSWAFASGDTTPMARIVIDNAATLGRDLTVRSSSPGRSRAS